FPSPPVQMRDKKPSWENPPVNLTELGQENGEEIGPFIDLSRGHTLPRRFELLQAFEGIVQDIGKSTFWAELLDLTDTANPPESAELPLSEISVPDRPLLEPGSVFYWSIGYETSSTGQIRRVSELRLRRTPQWSQRVMNSIQEKAEEL